MGSNTTCQAMKTFFLFKIINQHNLHQKPNHHCSAGLKFQYHFCRRIYFLPQNDPISSEISSGWVLLWGLQTASSRLKSYLPYGECHCNSKFISHVDLSLIGVTWCVIVTLLLLVNSWQIRHVLWIEFSFSQMHIQYEDSRNLRNPYDIS